MSVFPCISFALLTAIGFPELLFGAKEELTPIRQIFADPIVRKRNLAIHGTIRCPSASRMFFVSDDTGTIYCRNKTAQTPNEGDQVTLGGRIEHEELGFPWFTCESIAIIRHEAPAPPIAADPLEVTQGLKNYRDVIVEGVVTDIFPDDVDKGWSWMLIEKSAAKMAVALHVSHKDIATLDKYLDATISVTGFVRPDMDSRRFLKPFIAVEHINVVKQPPEDPFRCEEFLFSPLDQMEPVRTFAHRRRIHGVVTAVWPERNAFVKLASGHNIRIQISDKSTIPPVGTTVTAAGFLQKNAFFVSMKNALVRIDDSKPSPVTKPLPTPPRLTFNERGFITTGAILNGEIIELTGFVRRLSGDVGRSCVLDLDCDGSIVKAVLGPFAPPAVGSKVRIAGACIMDVETEDPDTLFTRLWGFSIAPRFQSDIVILASPPWWTPTTLVVLIAILLSLLGLLVLRSRIREKKARTEASLRLDERTRLAVELHDSLAQHLTGVSLQLDAAEMAKAESDTAAATHLSNARQSLRSCRENLRYCLSDLRSRSFEGLNMTEAILETVRPLVGTSHLHVRFNVPRARLSDSSAHAVLCIIRELAVNAIRHGRATDVHVAGEFRDGDIRFSVRDNGCGFDPQKRPGPAEGHFGLLGVRERVNAFSGALSVESAANGGTKVTVTLRPKTT